MITAKSRKLIKSWIHSRSQTELLLRILYSLRKKKDCLVFPSVVFCSNKSVLLCSN